MEPMHVVIGGVAIGAAYLIGDHLYSKNQIEGGSSRSTAESIAGAVRSVASSDCVPTVKVGMPVMSGNRVVDATNNTSNNLNGIAALCNEILCNNVGNGGDVAATFASCESQNGSLQNRCYNCSLFNIHWYQSAGFPGAIVGNEKIISFRTGAANDVEGFRRCITHFREFLMRRNPAALNAIRAGNFEEFQLCLSAMDYSAGYTNSVVGGRIRVPFMRQRYQRLVDAGLLARR